MHVHEEFEHFFESNKDYVYVLNLELILHVVEHFFESKKDYVHVLNLELILHVGHL